MTRPGWKIEITLDARAKQSAKMAKKLGERLAFLQRWMAYQLTEAAHQNVLELLPSGREHDRYRKSLKVARIPMGHKQEAYSLYADTQTQGVHEVDPAAIVLFVKPRRKSLSRPSPQVLVLQRHNPWTLDTIPFVPGRKEATVASRKVSAREVQAVAAARREDEPHWRMELARAGSRADKKNQMKLPKTPGKTIPDVAFEALRLEFGLGGVKAAPHWRPAIHDASRGLVRTALHRRADVVRLLSHPDFSGWMRWIPRLKVMRVTQARQFRAFQKQLHLRP